MANAAGELIAALFASVLLHSPMAAHSHPKVVGWAEESLIWPEKIAVRAKLDTDAQTSILDARHPVFFHKGGDEWVRFSLELKDSNNGQTVNQAFERKVVAVAHTTEPSASGRRAAVEMDICFGHQVLKEAFALDDRSKMHYPMLIGRPLIAKLGVVDAHRTFTTEPHCTASL